jgi:NAD(P)-dependent dehydrogenase (short-subunit alcohol dehydrogenase family)
LAKLTSALPVSEAFRGKTALVVGGSRGLGAAIVSALASQGCDVFLNFLSSRTEAEGLARSLPQEWGKVNLVQGDATDESWCREMRSRLADRGGLDVLVCTAVPSLRTLPFGLESIDRVRKFLDTSIAMTATPLAAFGFLLESRGGTAVIVSTVYAAENYDDLPADLHHYVASKRAVEGLARSLSTGAGQTRYLVARPPRLLTDQTNTVMGRLDSLAVEQAAAAIVARLISSRDPGRYLILEDFSDNPNGFPESSKS